MRVARVPAPAKINLWLRVLGPRPDGYHDLVTCFQALELADDVLVRSSEHDRRVLRASGPRMPVSGLGPDTANLAFRAAEEFSARARWPRGFEIELVKNIPVGGGLGGGSSDAAAVLRALNALAPSPLEPDALHGIAAALGSDVPFFLSGATIALGGGRGEIVRPLPSHDAPSPLSQADVLLIVPAFGIPTADAYGWLRNSGQYDAAGDRGAAIRARSSPSGWAALDDGNTFERVVEPRYPELRRYRERLAQAGATIARLSGSGSTVFGLFERGAPDAGSLDPGTLVIRTRTARSVVQVEVRQ